MALLKQGPIGKIVIIGSAERSENDVRNLKGHSIYSESLAPRDYLYKFEYFGDYLKLTR